MSPAKKSPDENIPLAADAVPGAEQPVRASSTSPLVTGLVIAVAALCLALALVSAMAMRGSSNAKQTVTVTVSQGGAVADQAAGAPTPETNLPEDKKKARLGIARNAKGDALSWGQDDAPVTMVEFADLRCPFCAKFSNEMIPELQKYVDEGVLRVEYRDLPLFGQESVDAAVAARAAGNQGKYHEYLTALYKDAPPQGGHPAMPREKLLAYAKTAGVPDMARFQKEMADPKLKAAVDADLTYAQGLGLSGTPAFVINTQFISGAQPVEVFKAFIEHEAKNNPRTA